MLQLFQRINVCYRLRSRSLEVICVRSWNRSHRWNVEQAEFTVVLVASASKGLEAHKTPPATRRGRTRAAAASRTRARTPHPRSRPCAWATRPTRCRTPTPARFRSPRYRRGPAVRRRSRTSPAAAPRRPATRARRTCADRRRHRLIALRRASVAGRPPLRHGEPSAHLPHRRR